MIRYFLCGLTAVLFFAAPSQADVLGRVEKRIVSLEKKVSALLKDQKKSSTQAKPVPKVIRLAGGC